jgi:hypothetical protein
MLNVPLVAAYAETDITPPLGTSMPGYFRDRKATGRLDPLKAKVLAMRQGKETIALVACDLIGMGASFVSQIRERVGDPSMTTWVHCSHTHTGGFLPRADAFTSDAEEIYPNFYEGEADASWTKQLPENIARAVKRAVSELKEEKQLTQHLGHQRTIAHYRRYVMKDGSVRTNPGRNNPNVVRAAGEIDSRVHVLRFESNRLLLVIYGMHPDCVGGTKFSADYLHHMTEMLRHSLGAEWRVLFLNACCGNINHVNIQDANQKSGPEESQRLGQLLGLAVLESLKEPKPLVVDRMQAKRVQVTSRLRRPSDADVKEAEALLARHKATGAGNPFGFNELFAPAAVVLAKTKDREHQAEIVALRLGSFALAGMPGEIFVELAHEVEAASGFKPTRTIGLVNGSMGYIPTRRGHAEGGYEAGYRSARYLPETGHEWARAAAELLRSMA